MPRSTAANDRPRPSTPSPPSTAGTKEPRRTEVVGRQAPSSTVTAGGPVAAFPFVAHPGLSALRRDELRASDLLPAAASSSRDAPAEAASSPSLSKPEVACEGQTPPRLTTLPLFPPTLAHPVPRAPTYGPMVRFPVFPATAAAAAALLCRPPVPSHHLLAGVQLRDHLAATAAFWPAAQCRVASIPVDDSPTRPSDASSPALQSATASATRYPEMPRSGSVCHLQAVTRTANLPDGVDNPRFCPLSVGAAEHHGVTVTADGRKRGTDVVCDSDASSSSSSSSFSRRPDAPPHFRCDACSKSYSTANGLTKHREFHCVATSGGRTRRQFVCPHCVAAAAESARDAAPDAPPPPPAKTYSSIGALKMHIRTHTLPCRCHLCGKAFSRPWLLQGHLRTHTGERPFRCPDCHRAFADRSNLRAHAQTHADVKRYQCRACAKTFSRMSLLLKHKEHGTGCC